MSNIIKDIIDRKADSLLIRKEAQRTELGIRSICVMYDDHSKDKNSGENIFIKNDSIHYRLFSLVHQYFLFLNQLNSSEVFLQEMNKEHPGKVMNFILDNPYFDKVELEVSSVFDSIIFHLMSVFDYLSHLIHYITITNKSNTKDWSSLMKSVNGSNNEFSNLEINNTILKINKELVTNLFKYRSALIHDKRDKHTFSINHNSQTTLNIQILSSKFSLKSFSLIRESVTEEQITIAFLSSWLIKQSFKEIELLLDALRNEILKNPNFEETLKNPKSGFTLISYDSKTNEAKPASEKLWEEYKNASN